MKKRVLVLTGGGDCPGLNAVIRAIVKRSQQEPEWEVVGCIEAFNGLLRSPRELLTLTDKEIGGIHVKGGTILGTTNKGNPLRFPIKQEDGSFIEVDRTDEIVQALKEENIDAVISIGGDGSQRISQVLFEKGINIIGVPKTIDNDLSATNRTFGFETAVQIATEAVDKLVTTAESHNRAIILEVMGRDAGWIALHAAVAGGAEVCLIPEIPYDIEKVKARIEARYKERRGFAIVVIAEGAKPKDGEVFGKVIAGAEHIKLGGVGHKLRAELEAIDTEAEMRVTVLGHLQRGGTPVAFDRVLATQFGVKAFELVLNRQYGRMVSYKNSTITDVTLKEATEAYNFIKPNHYLIKTAHGIGMSLGD